MSGHRTARSTIVYPATRGGPWASGYTMVDHVSGPGHAGDERQVARGYCARRSSRRTFSRPSPRGVLCGGRFRGYLRAACFAADFFAADLRGACFAADFLAADLVAADWAADLLAE